MSVWSTAKMKWSSYLILIISIVFCEGLDRTRVGNTATTGNNANENFLLNESGKGPNNPLQPQGQNQNSGGRVRELVNFFKDKAKPEISGLKNTPINSHSSNNNGPTNTMTNVTPNVPNNKHALPDKSAHNNGNQGTVNNNKQTSPINVPSSLPNAKPSDKPTFSEVLSGGHRGGTGPHANANNQGVGQSTHKPSTVPSNKNGEIKPSSPGASSTKPIVLPSSIVNNRQGNEPVSKNGVTDLELQTLSEELLRKDVNNAAKLITVNYQEKTSSGSKEDKAPKPLLVIPQSVYNIATIQKFLPLLDNYERDTLVNEYVTPQERSEENAFMDAIMQTQVIRHLMTFLKEKGFVTPDPKQQRDFLKQLWFNLYSRGRGKISSSGFEHVFVSELKNNEVSGLHNWLYFAKEEAANRINYLGYLKYIEISDKGAVLKLHFNQQGTDKPVDTMFVGTSPELEMALYSLCFITRHDTDCSLKMGGKQFNIVTHTFRYRSKNMIGSAYPQIN